MPIEMEKGIKRRELRQKKGSNVAGGRGGPTCARSRKPHSPPLRPSLAVAPVNSEKKNGRGDNKQNSSRARENRREKNCESPDGRKSARNREQGRGACKANRSTREEKTIRRLTARKEKITAGRKKGSGVSGRTSGVPSAGPPISMAANVVKRAGN